MILLVTALLSLVPVYVLYRLSDKPGNSYLVIYWLGGPVLALGVWNTIDFVWLSPDRITGEVNAGAGAATFILGILVALAGTTIIGFTGWTLRKYRSGKS